MGIGEQCREQRIEAVREYAQQPRRFYPGPLAFRTMFADHGSKNLLRGLGVLSLAGSCQECHDGDNDVKYKFKLRWPDIDHPSP